MRRWRAAPIRRRLLCSLSSFARAAFAAARRRVRARRRDGVRMNEALMCVMHRFAMCMNESFSMRAHQRIAVPPTPSYRRAHLPQRHDATLRVLAHRDRASSERIVQLATTRGASDRIDEGAAVAAFARFFSL